jgi:hypothetical protein
VKAVTDRVAGMLFSCPSSIMTDWSQFLDRELSGSVVKATVHPLCFLITSLARSVSLVSPVLEIKKKTSFSESWLM